MLHSAASLGVDLHCNGGLRACTSTKLASFLGAGFLEKAAQGHRQALARSLSVLQVAGAPST